MELTFTSSITLCLLSLLFIGTRLVGALECYACENQDSNTDKCVKTTKQCEEHQMACVSVIRWGLPPYWIPYGTRQHFVSKDCDTREACALKEVQMMPYCKRDWFDDWGCVECCTGDMCNYYVTLGASKRGYSLVLTMGSTCLAVVLRHICWT